MSYPAVFYIGTVPVHAHLIFEILAYSVGFQYYRWLRSRTSDAISNHNRIIIFIAAAGGAFLGSHLLGMVERPFVLASAFTSFIANKTVVGGLLGGLIAVELTKKRLGVYHSSGDLMTYPIILGMLIGRVGCHLHGLDDSTIGIQTSMIWGVDFGDGVLRHPVNLYEIVFLVVLATSIYILERNRALANGARFKIFMICYLLWRFMIEFIKPAHIWPFVGLSSIQIACILGLIYYQIDASRKQ